MARIQWTKAKEDQLWLMHTEHPGWSTAKLALWFKYPWKAVDSKLYSLKVQRQEHWLDASGTGFLDIEAGNLKANVGYFLSWALLMPDGSVKWDVTTKREIFRYEPDKRITASLIKAMRQCDTIVTFFGKGFDLPFARGRALYWGHNFPAYGELFHIDLFDFNKRLLGKTLTRLSLDASTTFLGIAGKTHYDVGLWGLGRLGQPTALDLIVQHNVADVEILRDLFIALGPYAKWQRQSI